MIDHLTLVVRDYEKSRSFYAGALAPTGHGKVVEIPARDGGRAKTAGFCHADGSDLWISEGEPNPSVTTRRESTRAPPAA